MFQKILTQRFGQNVSIMIWLDTKIDYLIGLYTWNKHINLHSASKVKDHIFPTIGHMYQGGRNRGNAVATSGDP